MRGGAALQGQIGRKRSMGSKGLGGAEIFAEIAAGLASSMKAERGASLEDAVLEPGGEKWRKAVMAAIDRTDEEALRSLLEGAPPPIFLDGERYNRRSPLKRAAGLLWAEGVRLLLEFKAAEPESLFEHEKDPCDSALDDAATRDPEIFRMLLEAEPDLKKKIEAARLAAQNESSCFLEAIEVLGKSGIEAMLKRGSPFDDDFAHMDYGIHSRWEQRNAEQAKAVARLAEMFPKEAGSRKTAEALWKEALRADVPELAEALASAGISPSGRKDRWEIELDKRYFSERSTGVLWSFDGERGKAEATILAAACWMGSRRVARGLFASAEMARRTRERKGSMRALSGVTDLETLRDMKEAGWDLASLQDPFTGRNPLHAIARFGFTGSFRNLKKALDLCPEWGTQMDKEGSSPASLCEKAETSAQLEREIAKRMVAPAPKRKAASRRRIL